MDGIRIDQLPRDNISELEEETKVKRKIVIAISLIQFFSNCAFVQMSPFYPIKAKERGVEQIYVGFIFSVMAFC